MSKLQDIKLELQSMRQDAIERLKRLGYTFVTYSPYWEDIQGSLGTVMVTKDSKDYIGILNYKGMIELYMFIEEI